MLFPFMWLRPMSRLPLILWSGFLFASGPGICRPDEAEMYLRFVLSHSTYVSAFAASSSLSASSSEYVRTVWDSRTRPLGMP